MGGLSALHNTVIRLKNQASIHEGTSHRPLVLVLHRFNGYDPLSTVVPNDCAAVWHEALMLTSNSIHITITPP